MNIEHMPEEWNYSFLNKTWLETSFKVSLKVFCCMRALYVYGFSKVYFIRWTELDADASLMARAVG